MKTVLPNGWCLLKLQDIAQWGSGGTPSRSKTSNYGGFIPWIKTGELGPMFITDTEEKITEEGLKNSSAKLFPKGAVAIAMYGATIGKTSILEIDAATNQACAVGIPNEGVTTSKFLCYYLRSQKEAFIDSGKGGAQPNISQTVVKNWSVALPPFNEQKRIADKLDVLLSQVDSCRERLERVPLLLKRFRQSVLAAATSGKLTETWREQEGLQLDEWKLCTIGELVSIKNGRAFPSGFYSSKGVRLLRPGNLDKSGHVSWRADNTVYLPQNFASDFPLYILGRGELLMNLTAQSLKDEFLGRACLKRDAEPALLNQRICAFYPKTPYDIRSFLLWYFKSPEFRSYVDTLDSGTLIKHMHSKQLLAHKILLPSELEQLQIVEIIEELFRLADQIEQRAEQIVTVLDRLVPSILAKAFRGELVPQDPNDEPAAELLKRISESTAPPPKGKATKKEKVLAKR